MKNIFAKAALPLICFSYGFAGVNFIVASFFRNNDSKILFFGIVLLCMVPISCYDDRKEMRGATYAKLSCAAHLMLSLFASALSSWWMMALYVAEVIVIASFLFMCYAKKKFK